MNKSIARRHKTEKFDREFRKNLICDFQKKSDRQKQKNLTREFKKRPLPALSAAVFLGGFGALRDVSSALYGDS